MDYYRNAGGWGTNQYQFPAPLAPNFQPQPSWGGMDFFRAHAASPDLSLYNHAWNRVRDYSGHGDSGLGVGMNEARHWHRRAYGGLGNATQMLPSEIGHAAAYEAYRTWIHNSSIYEPLSGDIGRQREGLIGLAIAEATRLLQFTGRSRDHYGRIEASDAAAASASIIFSQSRGFDDMDGAYHSRSRAGSFSGYGGASPYPGNPPYMGAGSYGGHSPYAGSSGYPPASPGDPYAFDNRVLHPSSRHRSRSRSRSRRHSSSHHHRPTVIVSGAPQYSSPMPIPGAGAMVPASSYNAYGSYGSHGQPMYAGSSGSYVQPVIVPSPRSHRHSISHHSRPRSAEPYAFAGSMGNVGYAGSHRY